MKQQWFVVPEKNDGSLALPEIAAWEAPYSLVHSPSGDVDACDAQWVGFFTNQDVAEKIKSLLENQ